MAAITTATLLTAGIASASIDHPGNPGRVMLEWYLDGAKKVTAATDTLNFFDIPAYCGMIIDAASIKTIKTGTASSTIDLQINTTDITGLTGWVADATPGTELVKLASGANTVINTTTAAPLDFQCNTGGVGSGQYRVRVWGVLLQA